MLGYPDQALNQLQDALELAQEISHPFTSAFVLSFAAMFYIESRAIQSGLHYADATLELAQEQSFAFWASIASLCQGACWALQGRTMEGIETVMQGTAAIVRMGGLISQPIALVFLTEAYLISGQAENGLKALDEGLYLLKDDGGECWEAEYHRLKGELLLLPGGSEAEAEESFNQALDVTRRQSAKSLELRAANGIARLWQKQGKQREARELLAEIYGWFTEGFDTPDLIDAKALLEELEQPAC